jgi:hypothetical protein
VVVVRVTEIGVEAIHVLGDAFDESGVLVGG